MVYRTLLSIACFCGGGSGDSVESCLPLASPVHDGPIASFPELTDTCDPVGSFPSVLYCHLVCVRFVSDGCGDYRVHLEHSENGSPTVGAFYRDEKGVALAMGTLEHPQSRDHIRRG